MLTSQTKRLLWREELYELIPQGGVIAELGAQRGYNAAVMEWVCRPSEMYVVDCWQHQSGPYEQDRANAPQEEQERLYQFVHSRFSGRRNVVVLRDFIHTLAVTFPDEYFDLIYLDACHLYEAVRQDLRDWWPKVKKGGLFCGHDYMDVNVPFIQVKKAVDEFCAELRLGLDFVTLGHCGSWGLWKR